MGTAMQTAFPFVALVRRELLTSLRETWLFLCLAALAIALGLVVVLAWPEEPLLAGAGAAASRQIFTTFCLVMVCGAAFLMPGLAAASIVNEHDGLTFDQLHLTLIGPGSMVAGKLVNSLGVFLLFYVSVLPMLATASFLVGMDLGQISLAAEVIFVCGVTCACFGLATGSLFRGSFRATVAAYVLMVLYMGLPIVFAMAAIEVLAGRFPATRAMERTLADWASAFTPGGALMKAGAAALPSGYFATLAAWSAALCAVSLIVARIRLSRSIEPTEAPAPRSKAPSSGRRRRTALAGFPDDANPIAARELLYSARWIRHSRRGIAWALAGFFFCSNALILTTLGGPPHASPILVSLILQAACTLAVAPACVANMLTKERTQGNLDLLRTTLLSPEEIVHGKAFAALGLLRPLLMAEVVGGLPLAVYALPPGLLAFTGAGYVTLLVSTLLAIAIGLVASAFGRNAGQSVVLAYGLNAALFVVEPLLLAVNSNGPTQFSENGGTVLVAPSPVFAYCMMGEWVLREQPMPFFGSPWLYWVICTGVQVALVVGCVRLATWVFRRRGQ